MPDLDKSVSKMLVKDLRDELRARNLDTKGLKADLQARLEEAIANEGGGSVAKSSSSEQVHFVPSLEFSNPSFYFSLPCVIFLKLTIEDC